MTDSLTPTEKAREAMKRLKENIEAAYQFRKKYFKDVPEDDIKKSYVFLSSGNPAFIPPLTALPTAWHLNQSDPRMLREYRAASGAFSKDAAVTAFRDMGIIPKGITKNRYTMTPGNGVTQLFAAASNALLTEEDVILVPVPTYGMFLRQLGKYSKATVVTFPLREEDGFKMTPESLDAAITHANKELARQAQAEGKPARRVTSYLRISPHNPTGVVESDKESVFAQAEILKKHGIKLVIDDLVYTGLEFDKNKPVIPMASAPGMFDRVVSLIGLSKVYGSPYLRAGMAIGPKDKIAPLQEYIADTVEFVSPLAELGLLVTFSRRYRKELGYYLDWVRKEYNGNARMLHDGLEGSPVKPLGFPDSGFFQILDVSALKGKYIGRQKIETALDFAFILEKMTGVMTLPGECFLYPDDRLVIRCNTSLPQQRMAYACEALKKIASLATDKPRKMDIVPELYPLSNDREEMRQPPFTEEPIQGLTDRYLDLEKDYEKLQDSHQRLKERYRSFKEMVQRVVNEGKER